LGVPTTSAGLEVHWWAKMLQNKREKQPSLIEALLPWHKPAARTWYSLSTLYPVHFLHFQTAVGIDYFPFPADPPAAENHACRAAKWAPRKEQWGGITKTSPGPSQAELRHAPAQERVDGASPLDIALGHSEVVLEVAAVEDQPLDVHRGPLLLLDLDLDVFHGVVRGDVERHGLVPRHLGRLEENLDGLLRRASAANKPNARKAAERQRCHSARDSSATTRHGTGRAPQLLMLAPSPQTITKGTRTPWVLMAGETHTRGEFGWKGVETHGAPSSLSGWPTNHLENLALCHNSNRLVAENPRSVFLNNARPGSCESSSFCPRRKNNNNAPSSRLDAPSSLLACAGESPRTCWFRRRSKAPIPIFQEGSWAGLAGSSVNQPQPPPRTHTNTRIDMLIACVRWSLPQPGRPLPASPPAPLEWSLWKGPRHTPAWGLESETPRGRRFSWQPLWCGNGSQHHGCEQGTVSVHAAPLSRRTLRLIWSRAHERETQNPMHTSSSGGRWWCSSIVSWRLFPCGTRVRA